MYFKGDKMIYNLLMLLELMTGDKYSHTPSIVYGSGLATVVGISSYGYEGVYCLVLDVGDGENPISVCSMYPIPPQVKVDDFIVYDQYKGLFTWSFELDIVTLGGKK